MARPGSILMIGAFGILPSKRRCSRQSILTVVSHREPSSRHIHCAFLYMSSCFLCELHWHSYWWCIINLWAVEQIKRVFDDKSMVTFCQFSIKHMLWVLTLESPRDDSINEYPHHVFHGEALNYHQRPSLSVPLLQETINRSMFLKSFTPRASVLITKLWWVFLVSFQGWNINQKDKNIFGIFRLSSKQIT